MKTLPFALCTILVLPLPAQLPDLSGWEKDFEQELARSKTPGASVGVVRDGKLVYAKGFGLGNVETGEAVRPDQLFRLGSTTKMMTATALAILARQGKVDFQAPIRNYVKNLPPSLGALTLHQLLSHTAGLKDAASMSGSHDDEALERYIRTWDDSWFFTRPGRVLSYSNPGYHLAGYVLETVTGQRYATAMEEILFRPLGMKRTTLRPLTAMTYPLAQGHNVSPITGKAVVVRPAADDASQWPAGSVFTSTEEWWRFAAALLDDGQLEGVRIWPQGVTTLISAPRAAAVEDPESGYGYGLLITRRGEVELWQHGGARNGYGSTLLLAPRQRTAILVSGNRSGASLGDAADKLLELLLSLPPEKQVDPGPLSPVSASAAAQMVGTYRNGDSVTKIETTDKGLKLRSENREFAVSLRGQDKLVAEKGPTVTIVRDAHGRGEFLCSGLRCAARTVE